jgi:hypothetical protein
MPLRAAARATGSRRRIPACRAEAPAVLAQRPSFAAWMRARPRSPHSPAPGSSASRIEASRLPVDADRGNFLTSGASAGAGGLISQQPRGFLEVLGGLQRLDAIRRAPSRSGSDGRSAASLRLLANSLAVSEPTAASGPTLGVSSPCARPDRAATVRQRLHRGDAGDGTRSSVDDQTRAALPSVR